MGQAITGALVMLVACGARTDLSDRSGDSSATFDAGVVAVGVCPVGLPGPRLVPETSPDGVPYCIDTTEVTNDDYATFLATKPDTNSQIATCAKNTSFVPPFNWPAKDGQKPVVNVDWCDARAYCAWAGKELCGAEGRVAAPAHVFDDATKSLWYSACSSGGSTVYPYGAVYVTTACNGLDLSLFDTLDVTEPVTCVTTNDIHDASGNVWEWENACEGDGDADRCRLRGGSFRSDATNLTCTAGMLVARNAIYDDFGFRCCAQ